MKLCNSNSYNPLLALLSMEKILWYYAQEGSKTHHGSILLQSLGVWRLARWCNSSLDCISYWLKIGANSSSSVLLRNYWLWLANLKIITLCVHCYLWTYSHIPTLIESIEQHSKATWWLRCYTAWMGEGYWALLNCSIPLWLNKHATPTQGTKPTEGFTEGYKMSYPPPPCSRGGTHIQSVPVSVITLTTRLFGSTHKSIQHLKWRGGKHWCAYYLGKGGGISLTWGLTPYLKAWWGWVYSL